MQKFITSSKKFLGVQNPFLEKGSGRRRHRFYKSGDLVCWMPDGDIKFLGRIDHQVKVRGNRIEPGEIESCLLGHESVKEAVVIAVGDRIADRELCAYVVTVSGELEIKELRRYLSGQLPEYMVPSYFMPIDAIPFTANGKLDRSALPEPERKSVTPYAAPRDEVEEKLVSIWSNILGVDETVLGIDTNFFQMGGHSLRAVVMLSRVHQELNVKLPLAEIFKSSTIRELAGVIAGSRKQRHLDIEPTELKEYYPLSSAQKRMFILQQMDEQGTGYNMPHMVLLGPDVVGDRIEAALRQLIERQESLRTAFIHVDGQPVQHIYDNLPAAFTLDYIDAGEEDVLDVIKRYTRPFDLGAARLMRSALISLSDGNHLWLVDMHHIISDGTSMIILTEEFSALYAGRELPPLRIQYRDFSQWQNGLFESGEIGKQTDYWLSCFQGDIPRLNLLADRRRPEVFTFEGDRFEFPIDPNHLKALDAFSDAGQGTLYMSIMAVLNVLFYKYTGQTDIIIGSGHAGRPHADLQQVVGMFVNTLAMRNFPDEEIRFSRFLEQVVEHSLNAFENQDVQFEELVDLLNLERNPSRNPLFDVSMVVQNFRSVGEGGGGERGGEAADQSLLPVVDEKSVGINYRNTTSKFDLTFFVAPGDPSVEDVPTTIVIEYYTAIYNASTIRRMSGHFNRILETVVKDPGIALKDIAIVTEEERRELLEDFNGEIVNYPVDRTIHELFERRVTEIPDRCAVVSGDAMLTYRELNRRAGQVGAYLYTSKHIRPGHTVGVMMEPVLERPLAVLGVLRSGGAYVPIDPKLPFDRIKYMVNDASVSVILSSEKHIRLLNHLQWECPGLHTFLCLDSYDIESAEEVEKSRLMDEGLWQHVGESADDDISGGGWTSSYTGQPLSMEEMNEYGDNILQKLEPLLKPHTRILEIGTASGISMFRIAPKVSLYYGTDLSEAIIRKNRETVTAKGIKNIKLACLKADEIDGIDETGFDIVIINSVIQCFHGHNYLRDVLRKCIGHLKETGFLFLGDIMDLDQRKAMIADLEDFKRSYRDSGDEAHRDYVTKTDFSEELFLSKDFWRDFEARYPDVKELVFSDKIHTIENELTRFRYDILITVVKQPLSGQLPASMIHGDRRGSSVLKYRDDLNELSRYGFEPPEFKQSSDSLAYIIYTSGTSGRPKGVMVEHASLVNCAMWHSGFLNVTCDDITVFYAGFGFDVSVIELFSSVVRGAAMQVLEESVRLDVAKLHDYFRTRCVSVGALPTQIFEAFNAYGDCPSLRAVYTGGDRLSNFRERSYTTYNMYGPTENTVVSSGCPVYEDMDPIHIGKPVINTAIYILNPENLQLQPVGVAGELCTGGDNLARGYLNQPELTTQKFIIPGKKLLGVQNPFLEKGFGRRRHAFYRTGDLARWMEDGNIEFLGRIDFQVKVRGYRIEPGEIEQVIVMHDGVEQVVVIAREDHGGEKYLVAYYTENEGAGDGVNDVELETLLSGRLPDYMIPSYFVKIESFPITRNDKIDVSALPDPYVRDETVASDDMPESELEGVLVEAWQDVLGKKEFGIDDNFFELDGHSLSLINVQRKLKDRLDREIPVVELFRYPTIRSLARFLDPENERKKERDGGLEEVPRGRRPVVSEDIAIIGMAVRFPGARNVEAFFENLGSGVESVSFFTEEEVTRSGVSEEVMNRPGYVKAHGALEDMDMFDAGFFGFTPRESEILDPQHRVFMECAWEALESGGYDPAQYDGSIGVYAGVAASKYLIHNLMSRPDVLGNSDGFEVSIGNDKDFVPTRVSYKLNLRGPSLNINTACSSSLVAAHTACRALIDGQCDMALAGGVAITVMKSGYLYQEGGVQSPDGHCRAFDSTAKGTVSGSGAGIVLLKRLDDALRHRDYIHAVIKSGAVNNDGSMKVGYTAPGVGGQSEAIVRAMENIDPNTVGYVETHGTGTVLGDPIEISALTEAFRKRGAEGENYCAIGAIKSNVGHLDTAAGVAGLIKVTLSLREKVIFPSLHFQNPNPSIDFANSPFYVNTRLRSWQRNESPRRAGVSSFGIGGTNAHLVVEEAPESGSSESTGISRPYPLMLISGRNDAALEQATENIASYVSGSSVSVSNPADAAYTLALGRRHFPFRRAVVLPDHQNEEHAFSQSLAGHSFSFLPEQNNSREAAPGVVLMFSGQGSQYVDMGLELYQDEPLFRETMEECARLLEPFTGCNMLDIIYPPHGGSDSSLSLKDTVYTQPALFMVEYSLARLWMSWGVRVRAMTGHSIGEYVAACLAGVFSLKDALYLVARRGRMMQDLPGGSMMALAMTEEEIAPFLGETLSLASVNGLGQCVVSGETDAVEALQEELQKKGIDGRMLHTSHAFHSHMMDPIVESFRREVERVELNAPEIPFISNVTGTWITADEAGDPRYWAKHLRQAVRFSDGLKELMHSHPSNMVYLETGPGKTLTTFALRHPDKPVSHSAFPSLPHPRDKQPAMRFLLLCLGKLWCMGGEIDWNAFYSNEKRNRVPLPTYPFQRQRYWIEPGNGGTAAVSSGDAQLPAAAKVKKDDMADWFYTPSWKRAPLPVNSSSKALSAKDREKPVYMLIGTDDGLLKALAESLRETGAQVLTVRPGNGFQQKGETDFLIGIGTEENYKLLFDEVAGRGETPDTVIHLLSIGDNAVSSDVSGQVGFRTLLYIARALGDLNLPEEVKIHIKVVSAHLFEVIGGEVVKPGTALLLGPVNVIPLEFPNLECSLTDIVVPGQPEKTGTDRSELALLAGQLTDEILSGSMEPVTALRGSFRWVRSFEPVRIESAGNPGHELPLREGGVYMVTGGLGGIGLEIAEFLAHRFRARLVLTRRSPFPRREMWEQILKRGDEEDKRIRDRINRLKGFERMGAEVLTVTADVAQGERMAAVVREVIARFGHIHGVVHAAGIPAGDLIRVKSVEEIEKPMAAKVRGTIVLDRVFKNIPLDFMIMCSSLSSVLGSIGQTGYSSANAFQDAYACVRNGYVIPGSAKPRFTASINWDGWQQVGMAAAVFKTGNQPGQMHPEPLKGEGREIDSPMLHRRTRVSETEEVFQSFFNPSRHWFLGEHRVMGRATLPGTAYLEMVRQAVLFSSFAPSVDHDTSDRITIDALYFLSPLMVEGNGDLEVRTTVRQRKSGYDVVIRSFTGIGPNPWQVHAQAEVSVHEKGDEKGDRLEKGDRPEIELGELGDRPGIEIGELGDRLEIGDRPGIEKGELEGRLEKGDRPEIELGDRPEEHFIRFGPRWSEAGKTLKPGKDEYRLHIKLPERFSDDSSHFHLHPALLDNALTTPTTTDMNMSNPTAAPGNLNWLPFSHKGVTLGRALPFPLEIYSYIRRTSDSETTDKLEFQVTVTDASGNLLVDIENYALRPFDPERMAGGPVSTGNAAEIDASVDPAREEHLKLALLPEEGVEAFQRILSSRIPQVLVSTHDLEKRIEESRKPLSLPADESGSPGSGERTASYPRPNMSKPYAEPESETEKALETIWSGLTGIDGVGRNDDFFELGGDSLLATQLISRVRESMDTELPMGVMFEKPTIAEMAGLIDSLKWTARSVSDIHDLTAEGEEMEEGEI